MAQPIINFNTSMEKVQINVAQLLKEPIGSIRSYHIEEQINSEGINSVRGDVILIRTNRAILVTGKMTASLRVDCSRCLKPVICEVHFDFEEEAIPGLTEESTSGGQCDSLTIDEAHVLDLSEAIRQYAWLAAPAKPLCRLDCAGICPTCGTDLNEKSCLCHSNNIGQRWSQLLVRKEYKD